RDGHVQADCRGPGATDRLLPPRRGWTLARTARRHDQVRLARRPLRPGRRGASRRAGGQGQGGPDGDRAMDVSEPGTPEPVRRLRQGLARMRLSRGLFVLPTLFTVGNLFCGYLSIWCSIRGTFETAAYLIIIAALLDALDGRIARLTHSASEFGEEYDSLADLVSFGVAPAVLA